MAKRRVTIDTEDDEGVTYRLSVSGPVTREKVLKIFETMNLIDLDEGAKQAPPDTVGGRIWGIVDAHYPLGGFTSSDLLEKYEDEYNLPIKLSIISTYLARFTQKGRISRQRRGREWMYSRAASRIPAPLLQPTDRPQERP